MEKKLENWLSSIVDSDNACGVSYEEMRSNIYNPLPSVYESIVENDGKEGLSSLRKMKTVDSTKIYNPAN